MRNILDELSYLGVKINRSSRIDYFVDIEKFALKCSIEAGKDIRVTRYIEYWFYSFGKYINLSRLNKLIKNGYSYNDRKLAALLDITTENLYLKVPVLKGNLSGKNFSNEELLNIPLPKNKDSRWGKFGYIAPVFIPDEINKHIASYEWIKKECPELSNRILGFSSHVADIYSYKEKHPVATKYRIAKDLNVSYSTVHRFFENHIKPQENNL